LGNRFSKISSIHHRAERRFACSMTDHTIGILKGLSMGRIAVIVTFFGLLAQSRTTFDLSADFSLQHNPDKVWQYGYSATHSLAPDQFRVDKHVDTTGPVEFWHPAADKEPGPGYYPYVAYNSAKQSQFGSSNGWAVRAGDVAMEASNSGHYRLIRFMAPVAGAYEVSAQFAGIHFGLSTTDVRVLHNEISLLDADIDGYGGDPAFHKIEGSSPTAAYSGQIEMKAHDTVTFAVGYGKHKTNFGDTTGLFARVVLLAGADSAGDGRSSQIRT
jgi:hypothetical protein